MGEEKRGRDVLEQHRGAELSILLLEEQILASRKNYNEIVTLLDYAQKHDSEQEVEHSTLALVALCRVFCRLIALGNLTKTGQISESERAIAEWLIERYNNYKKTLLNIISEGDVGRHSIAFTLLMRLIKEDAEHLKLSEKSIWKNGGTFSMVLEAIVYSADAAESRNDFIERYVQQYDDVRFHTFGRLRIIAKETESETVLNNVISMLAAVKSPPENKDELTYLFPRWLSEIKNGNGHKKQAQEAWLAVLRHDLSKQQRKSILGLVSYQIVPWFLNLELLLDFLTDAFNQGGASSLMALSGLFYLIQEKNLDYPQFYFRLYSLLDENILHSKHRSRFFRLLNTFLSSSHLPSALVASFVKKFSRLSLTAPPAAIVMVVPWIYNLLKSHPACTFMIHRAGKDQDGEDPFLMDEQDPMMTDAIESSLWEIHTLQDHYHPNVATIAKIICEQFTKQAYSLEDFLDHSYDSMLNAELVKDVKKAPEIEYHIPKKIFSSHEIEPGQKDSLPAELCSYS